VTSDSVSERPFRAADLILPLILVALAVLALAQSWARWLDPIIDTGRDLYIPGALLRGGRLYRDIRYEYLPLAPYLLAAIRKLIGGDLAAYIAIGIVQGAAVAAVLWRLGAAAGNRMAGFMSALLFVAFSFTGASTWGANFVFPYSYAATLGVLFLLVYELAFHRYLFGGRTARWLAALIVFGALSAWCKVEYALAVGTTFVLLAVLHRLPLRDWAAGILSAATSFAFAAWYFSDSRPGYDWLRDNVFAASLVQGQTARRFYAIAAGTANAPVALLEIGAAALVLCGLVVLFSRTRKEDVWRSPAAAASAALALIVVVGGWEYAFFRGWSALMAIALVWSLLRQRRGELLFFSLFALAAAVRIPLNIAPEWYGFALAVPLFAAIVFTAFVELPRRGVYSRGASLLWLPLAGLLSASSLWHQHLQYAAKQFPIATARGTFFDWNADRASVLTEFLGGMGGSGTRTLAVMPEGLALNYLGGVSTPLSFHTFTPPETADRRVEDVLLRELEVRAPDLVAIVTRDLREYGSAGFGLDYDQRTAALLRTRYRVAATWNRSRFALILLRRVP
jgi:hypothetical protein